MVWTGPGIPRAAISNVGALMNANDHSRNEPRPLSADVGPEDGLDPRDFFRREPPRRTNRKALQLCRQVERTLGFVLAGECGDDLLRELCVVSVVPAPNS